MTVTQSISESATTEFHPNKIGSKHNYTMSKGEMAIRTKDIANCPEVWTRRNDVEGAYYTGIHCLVPVHARTHVASVIKLIKQNKTQKQTTTKERNVHSQMN